MADLQAYLVKSPIFGGYDQKIHQEGEIIMQPPKHGNTRCGLHFKQIELYTGDLTGTDEESKTPDEKPGEKPTLANAITGSPKPAAKTPTAKKGSR
jgi:hypothetical protein